MQFELTAETVFDDRYKIVKHLGEGGMGSVYLAGDVELNRTVALKILDSGLFANEESFVRFQREGRVLSALRHPHIINVYRFGVWNRQVAYIAMELLSGRSLFSEIEKTGKITSERCARIGIQICEAMQHAHSNNIVHRDLKPANIMLDASDFVKVIDFGLARLSLEEYSQRLTRTGELVGSVHYMSPEQCLGKPADEFSDIYSLGCLLFECLSGAPPFVTDNPISVINLHVSGAVPKLPQSISNVDAWDYVLGRALAKAPEQRYLSMTQFAEDLHVIAEGKCDPQWKIRSNASARSWRGVVLAASALVAVVVVTLELKHIGLQQEQGPVVVESNREVRSVVAKHVWADLPKAYPYRREQLKPNERVPMLRLWLKTFGSTNERSLMLAHFWLCLELVGAACEVGYLTTSKGPSYSCAITRRFIPVEADEHRQAALGLLSKYLNQDRNDTTMYSELTYFQFVLKCLDLPTDERVELASEVLKDGPLCDRLQEQLHWYVFETLQSAGQYDDASEHLSSLENGALSTVRKIDNLLHRGKPQQARKLAEAAFDDLKGGRWSWFDQTRTHGLARMFLSLHLPEQALAVCRTCTEAGTMPRGITMQNRPCMAVSDHALLVTIALRDSNKRKEAAEMLSAVGMPDVATRRRLAPTFLMLNHTLQIAPGLVLMNMKLLPDDLGWLKDTSILFKGVRPRLHASLSARAQQLYSKPTGASLIISAQPTLDLVQILRGAGQQARAEEVLKEALAVMPKGPLSKNKLALELSLVETLAEENKPDEAQALLNSVMEAQSPKDRLISMSVFGKAEQMQGRIDQLSGKLVEASRHFAKAWLIIQKCLDVQAAEKVQLLEEYSRLLQSLGRTKEASIAEYESKKLMPDSLRGLYDMRLAGDR